MEKEFVPYEQALQLKELGFDEQFHCFGEYRQWNGSVPYLKLYQDVDGCSTDPADYEYTSDCIAPTFSQAFRWFREKYGISVSISINWEEGIGKDSSYGKYSCSLEHKSYDESIGEFIGVFKRYEEAELACLKKLIEIVKEK